jgi:hypothetical protein
MTDLKLEERLGGRAPTQQATVSCALILESPNGEFRKIFAYLNQKSPEACTRLAARIDPETGLMQEQYFIRRISYQLQARKWNHDVRGREIAGVYALLAPWEIEDTKTYLKTNKISPTQIIGIMEGGVVGAFFQCGVDDARKVLAGCPASGVFVPYTLNASFDELHESAVKELLPALKRGRDALRLGIAEAFAQPHDSSSPHPADAMIGRYVALHDSFERLSRKYP